MTKSGRNRSHEGAARRSFARASRGAAFLAGLAILTSPGCASLTGQLRYNAADQRFSLDSLTGPTSSQSAAQTLKAYEITKKPSFDQLEQLRSKLETSATPELVSAYAETSYLLARKCEKSRPLLAKQLYLASAICSYHYLFNPAVAGSRDDSIYSGQTKDAALLYNGACERLLVMAIAEAEKSGGAFPFRNGEAALIAGESASCLAFCKIRPGSWRPEEYDSFLVASECEVTPLAYDCRRDGLGVPLVVKRRPSPEYPRKEEKFYPAGICFPATALVRPNPRRSFAAIPALDSGENALDPTRTLLPGEETADATLEIYDSMREPDSILEGKFIPLETDYTTPLAYYLTANEKSVSKAGRLGLLKPERLLELIPAEETERERTLQGLYMVEPYDPNKIPVVMTHGLGSTPATWMEMYNALRNSAEIRNSYQFLFFFYPTGQPFWASAATMRSELRQFRETVDPEGQAPALDHMVLIGHSMGGLISKMQVQESGNRLWNKISNEDFESVGFDAETRESLREWFFFDPNPSVRRVITIATPFEGSDFANKFTTWLARHAIAFPQTVSRALGALASTSSGDAVFDETLLKTKTSVDSLSPKCPAFAALDECPTPNNVALDNIVGELPSLKKRAFGAKSSDGIVDLSSAHREDAELEKTVPASHTAIHMHPAAIMTVKEALAQHLAVAHVELAESGRSPAASAPSPTVRLPELPEDAPTVGPELPPELMPEPEPTRQGYFFTPPGGAVELPPELL